jgi:hypothetical protein
VAGLSVRLLSTSGSPAISTIKLTFDRDLIDPTHGDPVCTKDLFALRLLDAAADIEEGAQLAIRSAHDP